MGRERRRQRHIARCANEPAKLRQVRIEQLIEGDSDEGDGAEDFPRSERVEI